MDKGLTQQQVVTLLNANHDFVSDIENNKKTNYILVLYKVARFLGYIPKTLNIDESTLQGKLYAHRIWNGYSFNHVAEVIGVDKSTVSKFEKGLSRSKEMILIISDYLNMRHNPEI